MTTYYTLLTLYFISRVMIEAYLLSQCMHASIILYMVMLMVVMMRSTCYDDTCAAFMMIYRFCECIYSDF